MATPYDEAKLTMDRTNIMVDPNDALSLQYKKYKNSLYAQSLAKPSEYFKLKGELTEKLKTKLVTELYKTIYDLLRYGSINVAGTMTQVCGVDSDNKPRIPGVPSAKVNELSLQITATFDDFMEEIINILMPPSFLQLAESKLTQKSENIL